MSTKTIRFADSAILYSCPKCKEEKIATSENVIIPHSPHAIYFGCKKCQRHAVSISAHLVKNDTSMYDVQLIWYDEHGCTESIRVYSAHNTEWFTIE